MSHATRNKLRQTLVILSACGLFAVIGAVLASFVATTANSDNSLRHGSVKLVDNDANGAMYTVASGGDLAPGQSIERCIRVTYEGSLAASVAFYRDPADTIAYGDDFTIKVERGTQASPSFPSCTAFSATSTAFAEADLADFPTTYATGVAGKPAAAAWALNDEVIYRFTLKAKDDSTANANTTVANTGDHDFTWEARSN